MDERPMTLEIHVAVAVGPDGDAEEIAEATMQLRRELLDLDAEMAEFPQAGEPPPGTRAVDVAALGALVVNVAESQLLAGVLGAVRSWLAGSRARSWHSCGSCSRLKSCSWPVPLNQTYFSRPSVSHWTDWPEYRCSPCR